MSARTDARMATKVTLSQPNRGEWGGPSTRGYSVYGAIALSAFAMISHIYAQAPVRAIQLNHAKESLQLTERFRIGSERGLDDSFGRIRDIQQDRKGRVYIIDPTLMRVLLFDSTGRKVGTIGRQGDGPGEFQGPWKVFIGRGDSVFVVDLSLARLSVFSPTLAFVRSFRIHPGWGLNTFRELADGSFLVTGYNRGETGAVHVLSRAGSLVATLPAGGGRDTSTYLYGHESNLLGGSAAVDGDLIVFANKSPYELSILRRDGTLVQACVGDPAWTTNPQEVVRLEGRTVHLEWEKYVHVVGVHVVDPGLYLVVRRDPLQKLLVLDIVDKNCQLRYRRHSSAITDVFSLSNRLVLAVSAKEYPEVVGYFLSWR